MLGENRPGASYLPPGIVKFSTARFSLNRTGHVSIVVELFLSSRVYSFYPAMASSSHEMDAMRREISRLTQTVETLKKDEPRLRNRSFASEGDLPPVRQSCDWPPSLHLFGENPSVAQCGRDLSPDRLACEPPSSLHSHVEKPNGTQRGKRKEIEARRYNGKESVTDYLKQFELTAKRNNWDDQEKSSSLLCALDSTARTVLTEIDDTDRVTYDEIKQLLLKRFGPVVHTEVHEQALRDLRLSRGQPIRELATEVTRLTKLAYPDFEQPARNRLAVNALLNAVADKDVTFYIKDKNPTSIDEVCTLYERYRVFTGGSLRKPAAISGVKPEDNAHPDTHTSQSNELLTSLLKQSEAQQQQVNQLTDAVAQLLATQAAQVQTAPQPPFSVVSSQAAPVQTVPQQSYAAPTNQTAPPRLVLPRTQPRNSAPPGPCPRCKDPSHWRRDCPRQFSGNAAGPLPAPGPRSSLPPRGQ